MSENLRKNSTTSIKFLLFLILLFGCKCINGYIDEDGIERGEPIHEFESGRSEAAENANEAPCTYDNVEGGRICNCGYRSETLKLPIMAGNIYQVKIINCKSLIVRQNTFADLSTIVHLSFTNIEDLIFETAALNFPARQQPANRVQLNFLNTIIEEIPSHAISGNIDVMSFENCKIGIIRPFAITGLVGKVYKISIKNSAINRFEPQALKKFAVDKFIIQNTNFVSAIPSRTVYDVEVSDTFSISDSNFTALLPGAFMMAEVKTFRMQNNRINELNGGSLQMRIKSSITIQSNRIEKLNNLAFKSIELDSSYFSANSEPPDLYFLQNKIDITDRPYSISFASQFNVKIQKLYFISPLICANLEYLKTYPFLQNYADNIYFQIFNVKETNGNNNDNNYQTFSYILNNDCITKSYLMYGIIGGVSALVLVIIIAVVFIVLYWRKRKAQQQLNVIQPEGRTYRETQIVMQIENAGLLKTDL